jgi:hypothetical protein
LRRRTSAGLLDGVPLGVLDTVALVAVLGLAARGRSIRGARLAAGSPSS